MNGDMTKAARVEAVAIEAAGKAMAVWPRSGTESCWTIDPAIEALVGEIVDHAVGMAGGEAVLFDVTSALTRLVPISARRLRTMRAAHLRDTAIDAAAADLVELVAGDPAADLLAIGERVDRLLRLCGPTFESDVLVTLGRRLEVSAQSLRHYHDGFMVARVGGRELAKLVPSTLPYTVLLCLAPILRAKLTTCRKQTLIVRAAKEWARHRLSDTQAAALVGELLAERPAEDETPLVVVPAWHFPSGTTRRTAAVRPAA